MVATFGMPVRCGLIDTRIDVEPIPECLKYVEDQTRNSIQATESEEVTIDEIKEGPQEQW